MVDTTNPRLCPTVSTRSPDQSRASASHLPNFQKNEFRSLDFSKADFDEVNAGLEAVDWDILRESSSTEEFPKLFTSKLLELCLETIPRKK